MVRFSGMGLVFGQNMLRTRTNSWSNLRKTLLYASTLSVKVHKARRLRSLPMTCLLTCTPPWCRHSALALAAHKSFCALDGAFACLGREALQLMR